VSSPTKDKVPLKDLLWRVPAIGFCVWLAVACVLATDKVEAFGVKAAVFISAVLWLSLAGILVKAGVTFSSTPKDEDEE
jgi:hypothetical protein